MSLLEHDTTKKEWMDETTTQLKFEAGHNSKEYEIEAIWDGAIYAKKSEGYLPGFYYLVL